MKLWTLLSLTLMIVASPPAIAATPPPADTLQPAQDYSLREAIEYRQVGDVTLKLDMAVPTDEATARPAVICLFGGGWISGSRKSMRDRIEFFAAHGYVAIAPSYRLAPEHPFPAAVTDVRACVRWLRKHASEYGVDPNRIAAAGYSAGGHLACMAGLTSDTDNFGPEDAANSNTSARVQAVVNYFGPGDLAHIDWSDLANRKYIVPFLGGTPEEKPKTYRQASPVTYISADDPPVITLQGDVDRTVPMSISVDLHKRLEAAGVTNELVIVEGQGHGWKEPHRSRIRNRVLEFLNEHLSKTATKTNTPNNN